MRVGFLPRGRPGRLWPLLAVAVVVCLDGTSGARHWPVAVVGLLDEPAHLLTAWVLCQAVVRVGSPLLRWVLLGAVVIDADHVPLYVWGDQVSVPNGRPVTHSLITVLALLAAAATIRRLRVPMLGLAVGVALHFARDVATGPGLPLLWPVRSTSLLLPYWSYLAVLVACAAVAALHGPWPRRAERRGGRRGRRQPQTD